VIESYSSDLSPTLISDVKHLSDSLSDIGSSVETLTVHSEREPPTSLNVSGGDTLYGPDKTYTTALGSILETSIQFPMRGHAASVILGGSSLSVPKLSTSARVDSRYPVIMHINVISPSGDTNTEIDTSLIGEDNLKNPELYGIDVQDDSGVYTLTFPDDISCVDIIRTRGLLSTSTSLTASYRTAATFTSLLPGHVDREEETLILNISEGFVEDAPYPLFYIRNGRDVYVADGGELTLIKGRTPSSSLVSGEYIVVRERVIYRGEVKVQGATSVYKRDSSYVVDNLLTEGDVIINDRGEQSLVISDGSVLGQAGSGRLVYSSKKRLSDAISQVGDRPKTIDTSGQIDNVTLAELYEYIRQAEVYISSVRRCCAEIATLPSEYPLVNEIIRFHRKMGYDRASDLLSSLKIDEYMNLLESDSSYEAMLAEHTKTLQVKVVT